mgnify:CR=1 FL=1
MAHALIEEAQLAGRKCSDIRQRLVVLHYLQDDLGVNRGAGVRLVLVVYTKPDNLSTYDAIKSVVTAWANLMSAPDRFPKNFTDCLVVLAMNANILREVSRSLYVSIAM